MTAAPIKLIDTHQHLILRDRLGYTWADAIPALSGREFTQEDYARLTAGADVVGRLFMETGVDDADYKAEARLVAGLVGRDGLLGQVASCRPETDEGFDAWLDECAGRHVAGFRRILHVMPDGLSQTETFRRNVRRIGLRGFSFDLCVRADQHHLAEALARDCDEQTLVLDHCGNPDVAKDAFAPWAAGIRRLAALPHLVVKLSGITTNARPEQHRAEVLQPYLDHLLDCFGPDRMVWGGDWPVVDLGSGLPRWLDLTAELLAGLSPDEREAIGWRNACHVYRIEPTPDHQRGI